MKKILTTFSVALLLCGIGGTSASAAELDETVPNEACWADVNTGDTACAASQEDLALVMLNDFGVVLAGEVPEEFQVSSVEIQKARGAARGDVTIQASYLMGVWYDSTGYSGPSWTHTTTVSAPCDANQSFTYGDISALGVFAGLFGVNNWNNRIESFQAYNHCRFRFWADNGYGGSSFGPSKSSSNMGAFNNLASSLTVHHG